ncbi:hypothetical protein BKA64DRAFT_773603 [Cadophora sp. MPI-SDFR-AT-0126]|nr:hypothetical protein BKA64DRAFT_773603 [Leotiomycetes sp. MPI-SDFR-AT-0126]
MALTKVSILWPLLATLQCSFAVFDNSDGRKFTNAGNFQNPSAHVRPKFRYWLPDASVDPSLVAADIKSIGSLGAGGIEFLPYYNYGGEGAPQVTDWNVYGVGTPAYNRVLKAAAQASKENGLVMDLCMGAQSGQGAPAKSDNPGLAYDLVSFNTTVAPGGTFLGKIPGWGSGTLVSVTTALVVREANVTIPPILPPFLDGFFPPIANNSHVLAHDTLNDVTSKVKSDGSLSITFPTGSNGIKYIIYSAYYKLSGVRSCAPSPNPRNFFGNGSFAVDHFSAEGAKVTTDFLEKYVLVNGEDSVEIRSQVYWTPELSETFKSMHGYDIGKYVMLLASNNGLGLNPPGPENFETDAPGRGQAFVDDYRSTLSYLLTTYYQHLVDWSREYLGMQFSGQAQIIPIVDAPEDEALQFNDRIESYRQFVGPANIAGKSVISNEIGAALYASYKLTFPELLASVKRAWSAGNNQMVIHGATYSWQYPNTTWPGYTGFGYTYCEAHSRHQPAWEHGYSDAINYIARTNWVLQSGIPQRDLVFWKKASATHNSFPILYNFTDLESAGYGYEYISPENFRLPLATVEGGVLARSGPSYKALIIRQDDILTLDGTIKLANFARQGLPIIISGGIPSRIASPIGLSSAQANLRGILSLPNVHKVSAGALAASIASIGIQPRTRVSANSTWYTYCRKDDATKSDYVFVYNSGSNGEGTITFQTTRQPFFMDAWTGEILPVVEYKVSSGSTTIFLCLASGQTAIIAFTSANLRDSPPLHVSSAPSLILGYTYTKKAGLIAKIPASSAESSLTLSSGKSVSIPAQNIPTAFKLSNWTLIAESWRAPDNLYDSATLGVQRNTTHFLPELLPWQEIPGLANTSGVGYYDTSFSWTDTSVGAVIDFGRVVHTLRVKINGRQILPLDPTSPKADISEYLVKGKNRVEAVAATTLYNSLVPVFSRLQTSGDGPMLGPGDGFPAALKPIIDFLFPRFVEEGLVSIVTIVPYAGVQILK